MAPLDLSELDPGIRDIVGHLRAAGFDTTDSGDGRSKEPDPEVMPFAHVALHSGPARMISDADVLLVFLSAADVPPGFRIQASYDPEDETAVIMITWPGPL
jgi:hypothetical protein